MSQSSPFKTDDSPDHARLMADQMSVFRQTGWLHSTSCPLIEERGWATKCTCSPMQGGL